jgi:hypothetical protein
MFLGEVSTMRRMGRFWAVALGLLVVSAIATALVGCAHGEHHTGTGEHPSATEHPTESEQPTGAEHPQ